MSNLSPRQRLVITSLGVLLAVLAAWFLVVSPKRAEAARLAGEVQAAQDRLVAAQVEERSNREKQRRLPSPAALTKAMPDRVQMARILRELNSVGLATGVEFQSITPLPLKLERGYQALPLTVVFEGDFARVSTFLERLRKQVQIRGGKLDVKGRLFVIESLQLAEGDAKFPSLKATLTLDAFVFGNRLPVPGTS